MRFRYQQMHKATTFTRSDGDPSQWPVCGKSMDGKHWERLKSDNDLVVQYLEKLSHQLSDQFGWPHAIHSLPEGYALFIKHTTKGSRRDRFLIGSPHTKGFRSPAEFAPHAFWLLNDLSLLNSNCLCKYCSKKPTRGGKRSESIASGPIVPHPPSRTHRISRSSSSLTRTSRPSTNKEARRIFRVTKVPLDLVPEDSQSPGDDVGPLYRKGEIVWVVLDRPVMLGCVDGATDGFIIRFWPSIIENYDNPLAAPHNDGTSAVAPFRVRLPSSGVVYDVPQHHTLPFWAHSPDELWLQKLRLQTDKTIPGAQDSFAGLVGVLGSSPGEATSNFNTGDLLFHFLSDVDAILELTRSWSATPMIPPSQSREIPTQIQPRPPAIPSFYRELWWGAERIMVGDLIRLKVPESRLPGLGVGQTQFAPQPVSEPPVEATPAGGPETEDGQLFFKLRCLATVAGTNGKELHGFGGLYRLVPVGSGPLPPSTADIGDGEPVLPHPPEGLAFHPILQGGWEIELSLHHIDGRYYPQLQELLPEPSGVDAHILEVLEGVACWRTPQLRPIHFKKGAREEIIAQIIGELRKLMEGGLPQGQKN